MCGIIETHPAPVSKKAIRETVVTKTIVDNPGRPHESIHWTVFTLGCLARTTCYDTC